MFGNLIRSMEFDVSLASLREKQRPAKDRGEAQCCRSGHCCWRRPCDLGPGDPAAIAAHLGISERKLFKKYLVVDTGASSQLVLKPRRVEQGGGRMLASDETFDISTPCVFLDEKNDNACKIHEVKPFGGRDFKCWVPGSGAEPEWKREDLKALGWDGVNPDDGDDE